MSSSETRPPPIVVPVDDPLVDGDLKTLALKTMAPAQFLIHQAGTDRPERLTATTDEEARALVTRRVRTARGDAVVFLYKLVGVERFVPSSEFFPVDEMRIENGQFQFPASEPKDV